MALTAQNVIDRARDILQDTASVRWSDAELLRWLNDGRREMVTVRPDIYASVTVITLVSGTKQSIPGDGAVFLTAYRNIDAQGSPTTTVRPVDRMTLDALLPGWHAAAAGATKHYMLDLAVPKVFWVYPQAAAGAKLEIAYAKDPADITVTTTSLTEEANYAFALVDYLCFRALSKDADHVDNASRAAIYFDRFYKLLGTSVGEAA